ncbi:GtrB-like O-antigen conversion [Baekduia alba]|uniref:glycosyltransferase family 2 protein n=1 Tax=Baekduia alba TaxID=2997333 RepID=UPI002341E745|nr:glycosyltransferase family 2 protein [Baekduia alba]WCB96196.1 GtrB-like O-antigen conversion [Baekduia alba]
MERLGDDAGRVPLPRLAGVSIVLPCHDEAGNVARMVGEATAAARAVADAHEILVVDDGSTDATRAVAAEAARCDERVRLLVHDGNRGYGVALRTGFAAARLEWVFLTDADCQFDLMDLVAALPLAAASDLVCGYRVRRADPLHRRLNARAWNGLVDHMFALGVRDVDCAFKLMRRELVQGLALEADGAVVSTELLVRARAAGARIGELGVTHRPRAAGRSSGADPAVVLRAFRELRALRAQLRAETGGGATSPGAARPRPA